MELGVNAKSIGEWVRRAEESGGSRRLPVLNRVLGHPQGDLASLHECPVVFGPIVDSIFRLVVGMDSGVHAEKVAHSAIG
jgi:hypothetical protein